MGGGVTRPRDGHLLEAIGKYSDGVPLTWNPEYTSASITALLHEDAASQISCSTKADGFLVSEHILYLLCCRYVTIFEVIFDSQQTGILGIGLLQTTDENPTAVLSNKFSLGQERNSWGLVSIHMGADVSGHSQLLHDTAVFGIGPSVKTGDIIALVIESNAVDLAVEPDDSEDWQQQEADCSIVASWFVNSKEVGSMTIPLTTLNLEQYYLRAIVQLSYGIRLKPVSIGMLADNWTEIEQTSEHHDMVDIPICNEPKPHTAASISPLPAAEERALCVVCMDETPHVVLMPCRHLCVCGSCAKQIHAHASICPLCRSLVVYTLSVFV